MAQGKDAMREMTVAEFEDLLDRWGAEIDAWPLDERAAAGRLIEGSEDAGEAYKRAQYLAAVMRQAPPVLASPELKARILEAAASGGKVARTGGNALLHILWPFGPLWRPVAGLAVAAFLGGSIGFTVLNGGTTDDQLTGGFAEDVMVIASVITTGVDQANDF